MYVCSCVSVILFRLRTVSYFSLQSYFTRNPSTRAAINDWAQARKEKVGERPFSSGPNPYCNIRSCLFAVALAEIRTRWILREGGLQAVYCDNSLVQSTFLTVSFQGLSLSVLPSFDRFFDLLSISSSANWKCLVLQRFKNFLPRRSILLKG